MARAQTGLSDPLCSCVCSELTEQPLSDDHRAHMKYTVSKRTKRTRKRVIETIGGGVHNTARRQLRAATSARSRGTCAGNRQVSRPYLSMCCQRQIVAWWPGQAPRTRMESCAVQVTRWPSQRVGGQQTTTYRFLPGGPDTAACRPRLRSAVNQSKAQAVDLHDAAERFCTCAEHPPAGL